MVIGIVKRDEHEFNEWLRTQAARAAEKLEAIGLKNPSDLLSTELGWLLCLGKYDGRLLDFDLYQLRFLTLPQQIRFRAMLKGRQVGFSFIIAAEALARSHLKEKHASIFISYNLDDAKQKIELVKELHDSLPLEFQKKMVVDSKTEVAFASNTSARRLAKITSWPSKPPRGKSGDVYLDELAFAQNGRDIYTGATALITRSKGQLTIGSTPLGQSGIFWEIYTESLEDYPDFWRQRVPWWLCRHFCKDVATAGVEAETMLTEDRVARFGTPELLYQYNALPEEDFKQEYELDFQDERVAFFPYETILPNCQKDRQQIPVYDSIEGLAARMRDLGPLTAGFDVGRTKHPSELHIFDETDQTLALRFAESYRDVPFPTQRARLFKIIDMIRDHLKIFRIDRTGLGRNLAEDLTKRYGRKIEAVEFSNTIKVDLANSLKILMEERSIDLPNDRVLISQLHSVKQKITSAGNSIFDVERNAKHHADKVWSIALATWRKNQRRTGPGKVRALVLGGRKNIPPVTSTSTSAEPGTTFDTLFLDVARRTMDEGIVTPPHVLRAVPKTDLERRLRQLLLSARVWKRSRDEHQLKIVGSEYKRVKRELERRARLHRPDPVAVVDDDEGDED